MSPRTVSRSARRISRLVVLVGTALGVAPFACSGEKAPDRGGLMLLISEDGALGIDRLVIDVASNGVPVRTSDLRVPTDAQLPTSLGIASNGNPNTSVSIAVSGFRGDAALDRRDLTIKNVPTDRVSEVTVLLSARCTDKVTKDGAFARSLCPPGTTCNPAASAAGSVCTSSEVDGTTLPSYDPSKDPSNDAAVDDAEAGLVDVAPDGPSGLVTCTGATEKRCDNKCVSVLDPQYGCGSPTCTNCDLDGTTVWGCNAGACSVVTCAAGYKLCAAKCVAIDDPNYGCGPTSCDASACPAVGEPSTLVCDAGTCKIGTCGAGTKKCGTRCVPTIRQYGCEGAACGACAATETCQGAPKACTCAADDVTACKDKECGPAVNNCGTAITCPSTCCANVTCGGNTCGCVPNSIDVTCAGKECGAVVDNCGITVQCPNTCTAGLQACGSVTPNKCDLPPSCAGGGAGKTDCRGESCCLSTLVPAGTFNRQNNAGLPATISAFRLDKYKVTVGRFRAFVNAWLAGWRPQAGAGKHVHLNGGNGLIVTPASGPNPAVYESGWKGTYANALPTTKTEWDTGLGGGNFKTWTPAPGALEKRPIANLQWYEAYAFCVWDGGFLPTFAETNYAHAGGDEQRVYPWGAATPTTEYANFCPTTLPDGGPPPVCIQQPLDVGATPLGDGRWGHVDLVGGNRSWVQDGEGVLNPCVDCLSTGYARYILTGAGTASNESSVPTSYFDRDYPEIRQQTAGADPNSHGVRCARVP